MTDQEPLMVCATCKRVLDEVTHGSRERSYVHALQDKMHGADEDHTPVPVASGSVAYIGRCDFCNIDHPRWGIPVKTFNLPQVGGVSKGDWAACNACCGLIKAGHWESLVRRAANHSSLRAVLPAYETREILRGLYKTIKANLKGEPYPIER